MDLSTRWLGLDLSSPLMAGASPLADQLDQVRRLEDAGAPAIVMRSLFEEQIERDERGTLDAIRLHADAHAEALSYFPEPAAYSLGPDRYLEQLRLIKESVGVPVIASLNGTTPSGWLHYAGLLEQAGADALELNVYYLATDPEESGDAVERRTIEIVRTVKASVRIPVAAKLSPFFSSLPHFVKRLEKAGVDGIVLFNRFYQPDIDPVALEAVPALRRSDPSELLLRLRWLAILAGKTECTLACSGGVHDGTDAVKAIMAGAHVVQVVSALLRHGPARLATIREQLVRFCEENEIDSIARIRGNMSLARCPDPGAFERANYVRVLQTWHPA